MFSQVFDYNGFGRIDQASPNQLLSKAIGVQLGSAPAGFEPSASTGWIRARPPPG